MKKNLPCPKCQQLLWMYDGMPAVFDCSWCCEPLTVQDEKLVSALPHIKQMVKFAKDYEPEQKYGTAHDFREHRRHGGTRDDY